MPNGIEDQNKLNEKLKTLLSEKQSLPVAFPPCSDLFLSLVKKFEDEESQKVLGVQDNVIIDIFKEYFLPKRHIIFSEDDWKNKYGKYFRCNGEPKELPGQDTLDLCLPSSCITLEGNRRLVENGISPKELTGIKRLFTGDLVWLFFMEKLGIFKMTGYILDDFATNGRYPMTNGNLTSIVLEAMIRETNKGMSSTTRDRFFSYVRVLGWIPDSSETAMLHSRVIVNHAFDSLFNSFMQNALAYYRQRRLADAIAGVNSPEIVATSISTVRAIADQIDLLKKAFITFDYGRNHTNTLSGIVWIIAGMSLIRELRLSLGIPYNEPFQYFSAAYDLLILNKSLTPSHTNRFKLYFDCAENARDVLLDIEVLDFNNLSEVQTWLDLVEGKIEAYSGAYHELTGSDLAVNTNSQAPHSQGIQLHPIAIPTTNVGVIRESAPSKINAFIESSSIKYNEPKREQFRESASIKG